MTVLAAHAWATNGHLIADVAKLGYLHEDWPTLDAAYGEGVFWKVFRPTELIANDLDPYLGDVHHDFSNLPFADGTFDASVLDAPYKLNGTPDPAADRRYGVHEKVASKVRKSLQLAGVAECWRVTKHKGYVLVKTMDMVSNGVVHWQTDEVTEVGAELGMRKVDRFDLLVTPRPQPERTRKCKPCRGVGEFEEGNGAVRWDCGHCGGTGRIPSRQQHAARNYSSLLVFKKL